MEKVFPVMDRDKLSFIFNKMFFSGFNAKVRESIFLDGAELYNSY
jgi:hypothetical protein